MLESVLLTQQKQNEYSKKLESKVYLLISHNKMIETQIAQQASSLTTPPGRLPNKPEQNPREQCNATVLRSGTQLKGPKGVSDEIGSEREEEKGVAPLPNRSEPQEKRENEKEKESKTFTPKPYMPPLPFAQRFAKAKLDP